MKNIIIQTFFILILASCNTYKHAQPLWWANPFDYGNKNVKTTTSSEIKDTSKIIIYNATLALMVNNSDSLNSRITEIAKRYAGYVQTIGTSKSIIRVQSEKLNVALQDICNLGNVVDKEIHGEDVTESYWDFKIRLDNATRARETYLALLKKAENVESALKVEKELERLNGEIDILEGKMQKLSHLSQYSTITINIKPKPKPGILGYLGIGIYKTVKWLFVR